MKKRIIPLLCLTALCITMFCALHAHAVTPLDPAADASLTLHYQKDGQAFPDLSVEIYRVAMAFENGTFGMIEPFAFYPVNIHGISTQEQWKHVAATLSAYIVADQVAPTRKESTDEAGVVKFKDLETGLYLVRQVVAENNSGTYVFDTFVVYLPTPQEDGSFDYDVEANPKCVNYVPKEQYTVTKLWQDAGHQSDRPEEVNVEIYRDGELRETQILSANNNWSYTWYVSEEDHGEWTVVERSVPDAYTVTVQRSDGVFTLINTHEANLEIPDGPQTGDTTNLVPFLVIMCISGMMLVLLGLYRRRQSDV